MKKLMSWIFGAVKSKKTLAVVAEVKSEAAALFTEENEVAGCHFHLSETGQEYLRRKAEIVEASSLHQKCLETKVSELRKKAELLEDEQGSPAKCELNKREMALLLKEAKEIERTDFGRFEFRSLLNNLPEKIRAEEAMMIAHEGQIILQSPGVALKLDKTERRIVLFRGKFYLIMLEYPAIRDESRMMKITWQGRYNRECSMMVGKPTGEFGPPQVERAIASLDQFNGAELRAVEKAERSE